MTTSTWTSYTKNLMCVVLNIVSCMIYLYVYPLALSISVGGSIEFGTKVGNYYWQQDIA